MCTAHAGEGHRTATTHAAAETSAMPAASAAVPTTTSTVRKNRRRERNSRGECRRHETREEAVLHPKILLH
jgi:hypothetical protein